MSARPAGRSGAVLSRGAASGLGIRRAVGARHDRGADRGHPVWLFDLDDTLHNASHRVFAELRLSMTDYIECQLQVQRDEADRLRVHYWSRYGATLLGLLRHHDIEAGHFLAETHRLPGLEDGLQGHLHDLAALRRLPGRKILLTNAPLAYAHRVLRALGLSASFNAVLGFEQMRMFGQHRPKPDARMFRALVASLGVAAGRCVLVEDTLVHQKTAHAVGMRTVWMQRWVRRAGASDPARSRLNRRPAYVDRRVRSLTALRRAV